MTAPGFLKLAVTSASTKRSPAPSSGKVTAPVTNLSGLLVTPLAQIGSNLNESYGLASTMKLSHVYVEGALDIRELTDWLVISATEYQIMHVATWRASGWNFMELIVEELKP